MDYQLLKRDRNVPVQGLEREAPQVQPQRAAMGIMSDGEGMGAQLDELMQARMQRMINRQIPSAEREADQLASSVTASTPAQVKAQLGEQMGADFSDVRFHTGADAVGKAEGIGARAYATGRDIYFGEDGFDPTVAAHELVHTAQQGMVSSGVSTVSAPAGGIQMWPKWNDFKRGVGNVGTVIGQGLGMAGRGIANGAKALGGGIARGAKAVGRGIGGLASKMWKGITGGGRANTPATQTPPPPATTGPQPQPVGTSMSKLEGEYVSDDMQTKVDELFPIAQSNILHESEHRTATDGDRFFYMRGSNNDVRSNYFKQMRLAGRNTNKQMMPLLAQNLDSLPDVDTGDSFVSGYKAMEKDDPRRQEFQERSLQMTQQYLQLLKSDPKAIDALRKSSSGMYGRLGNYGEDNKAGLVGGKLEAAHRAMNDMVLRSFGTDATQGRNDLALSRGDDKKVAIVSQGMGAMQPAVLTAIVDPSKMDDLTPQEKQMAVMYQQFFQEAGML